MRKTMISLISAFIKSLPALIKGIYHLRKAILGWHTSGENAYA